MEITFFDNGGNASGGKASAHTLFCQIVLALSAPILVSLRPSPQSTKGRQSSWGGCGVLKTCDGPKRRKCVIVARKKANNKIFNLLNLQLWHNYNSHDKYYKYNLHQRIMKVKTGGTCWDKEQGQLYKHSHVAPVIETLGIVPPTGLTQNQ